MTIFLQTLRATAVQLALPLIGVLLLCYSCLWLVPQQAGTGADRAAGQWLHLAGLLLVATALAAALEGWPLLSRSRPGFAWILRIENRPLHGCAAAALGSCVALAIALGVAGLAFWLLLEATGFEQPEVHGHATVQPTQDRPYLDERNQTLVFRIHDPRKLRQVVLQPAAIYAGKEVRPSRIRVSVDDRRLHPSEFVESTGGRLVFPIEPPVPIQVLTVHRATGPGVVLRLQPDDVQLITAATQPGAINGLLASLSYLAPAMLAFAVMILGHAHLALPVNLAAGVVVCLLATLLGVTPNAAAITAFARGRWLPDENVWSGSGLAATFAVAAVAVRHAAGMAFGHRRPLPAGPLPPRSLPTQPDRAPR